MLPRVVPTLARLLRLGIARPNLSLTRLDAAEPKPAGPMASLEIYTDSLEKRQTEETASAEGTIQTLLELVDKHRGMSRAAAARGQQDAQERLLRNAGRACGNSGPAGRAARVFPGGNSSAVGIRRPSRHCRRAAQSSESRRCGPGWAAGNRMGAGGAVLGKERR